MSILWRKDDIEFLSKILEIELKRNLFNNNDY
jgi:hypothetical protein